MCVYMCEYIHTCKENRTEINAAQSAGGVEYTDCTSAEGLHPPPMSALDMTLNNLMVRFQ